MSTTSELRALDKQYLWHPFTHMRPWLADDHQLLVITAAGGEVWTWDGAGWSVAATVPALVDPDTNVMAATLPSPTLILLAWTTGCLFAVAGALTYAERGTMFPRAGGVYVFLSEAFGPLVGFLYGWASLLVVLSGGTAAAVSPSMPTSCM